MNIDARSPLGGVVTDATLTDLTDQDVAELRTALAEHGVLVLPGQEIDDDEFETFLRRFGDLVFTTGETPLPGHPDLNVISNVGRTTPPRSSFHVDSSYFAVPPAYTALRAVDIPAEGGETLFSNQYRAYDTLPDDLREQLTGRTVTHVVTGIDPADLGPDDDTSAQHPVFRPNPVSGRVALYLSTPQRCVAISGMDAAQTADTIERLLAHSTREDNVYRHRWAPGDVVIWDNGAVLHRADHSGVIGDRVMHRGMVAGVA